MSKQEFQIFVVGGLFATRNKGHVQNMFSEAKIESHGWTCTVFFDCIKCTCKRQDKKGTSQYILRINRGGHVTFRLIKPNGDTKMLKEVNLDFRPELIDDCVIGLSCSDTPAFYIRSMKEQHVFEKHHFSVHMCQDPNGVYDIQSYISPTSQEYKKVYTDGKVVTVIHKDIEAKNGNGKFKDMEGHVVVSGANYVIYRCKHHYKNTESLCSDVLISKHTVLEVDELIKNQLEKQRKVKNNMAST